MNDINPRGFQSNFILRHQYIGTIIRTWVPARAVIKSQAGGTQI